MDYRKGTQSREHEDLLESYFGQRPGWAVTGIDKHGGADFRMCHGSESFLCEVKTLHSVRATTPYAPAQDYQVEMRDRRKEELERLHELDPHKCRILSGPEEIEWLELDEPELRRRIQGTVRHTQTHFEAFERSVRLHFAETDVQDLPYSVKIDSGAPYEPTHEELRDFCEWLEEGIRGIHAGVTAREWRIDQRQWASSPRSHSSRYIIHQGQGYFEAQSTLYVQVRGPLDGSGLSFEFHCSGGLNLDRMWASLAKAAVQLRVSASRDDDQSYPRVVMFTFAFATGHEWGEKLEEPIGELLRGRPDVSALVLLRWWVPDVSPFPRENGASVLTRFRFDAQAVPDLIVFHNDPASMTVMPLPRSVFRDEKAQQFGLSTNASYL